MTDTLRLRITVEQPPAGVAMQVQRGRDGLLPPARATPDSLSFEFDVRLGTALSGRPLRLLGEFTQGPVDARFVYVNAGTSAGQFGSCWTRRAKVPLREITPGHFAACHLRG